jgi:3-oxoacyl-[acyl-carrier-protein] synthase-1
LHDALKQGRSGLRPNDYPESGLDTWIGRVEEADTHQLPQTWASLDSRNNRLADLALSLDGFDQAVETIREQVGAHRIGVILGTSTASIGRTESAYAALDNGRVTPRFQQPTVHNPHSVGHFVANRLGLGGPSMSISTACSSSGKVFAAAARWLNASVVDAVVVGGVDSLCLSILHGFASLELISTQQCRPFDADRDGINIGEAAGFALLLPAATAGYEFHLAGSGETSDAWHMAQPHPEGLGARDAMRHALDTAGLSPADIGYVNLHGTATPANDVTEARALAGVFDSPVPASSTKAWTGHTLGAAGIVGAVTALDVLSSGHVPGTLNLTTPEAGLAYPVLQHSTTTQRDHVMCNSLGFGGNNCSLIFGRTG